jgi:uncharacterized protein (DUF427 family)
MSEIRERVHIEDGPKRVRAYLGGELIADTKRLQLVWEVSRTNPRITSRGRTYAWSR